MNPILLISYQIYLLQLENYNITRTARAFIKTIRRYRLPRRTDITWTNKFILVTALSIVFYLTTSIAIGLFIYTKYKEIGYIIPFLSILASLYFFSFVFILFIALSILILSPFDFVIKHTLIKMARKKINSLKNLIIIGVAGSYGKTTMKEMVSTLLQEKFNLVKTPDTINTHLGVARTILKELDPLTEVFVIEMGEHTKGDIKNLCSLASPDIGIITGINEAHLERMGSIENTKDAIFELTRNSKKDATILLNADDSLIRNTYKKHITPTQKIVFYSAQNHNLSEKKIDNITYKENGLGISFTLYNSDKTSSRHSIPMLGTYSIGVFQASYIIANQLGVTVDGIKKMCAKISTIPHRLEPIYNKNSDILVIDDSYNGNPNGVREALRVLSRFTKRRRIFITPGLVELGKKSDSIHYSIGTLVAGVADCVILIKTNATPHIRRGLLDSGFSSTSIHTYNTASEAHTAIPILSKSGDIILFQNDWTDNYY